MLVERLTFRMKWGKSGEGTKMLQDWWKAWDSDHVIAHRIYEPDAGPFWTVIHEIEFEDSEQRAKWHASFSSLPDADQWFEKWRTLVDSGSSELLTRVE